VAGDIYSQPPHAGRGGWSWYTGSAAWLHRAALESICGLQWRGERITLSPCLPSAWVQIELRVRKGGVGARMVICRDTASAAIAAALAEGALRVNAGELLVLPHIEQARTYLITLAANAPDTPDAAPQALQAQVRSI
jgi:cyclic beta-1,2-glucan synthetase